MRLVLSQITILFLVILCIPADSRNLHGGTVAPSVPFVPATQISLGDSITYGDLASPVTLGYAYLFSADISTTLSNYGNPGSHACDNNAVDGTISTTSGGYNPVPSLTASTVYTYAYGANDVGSGSSYQPIFDLCQEASIAWLAIPITSKVLAYTCTKSGSWVDDTSPAPSNGTSSTTSGATLTCSITTTGEPIYLWYRAINGSTGSFTYNLDGSGSVSLNTVISPTINSATNDAWILQRLTGVSAGSHSLVITQTASGQTVDIWAIGSPPSTSYNGQMRILVMNVLHHMNGDNDSGTLAYSNAVAAEVTLLQGDNLPVSLVDCRDAINDATQMADPLHPNTSGHASCGAEFFSVFP